jgi:hypothetical protein
MKKRKPIAAPKSDHQDNPTTLKDLLSPDVLSKLKEQAASMKAEEAKRKEDIRQAAEDARRAELKRLENDFEHLLNSSNKDWSKFK